MWKRCVNISLGYGLFWASLFTAHGQGGLTTGREVPAPSQGRSAEMTASGPGGGLFESNTFMQMANRVFDPSSDAMDFENGRFEWKGKNFSLTEQRAFRSRLERFLLASPSEEDDAYAAVMAEILERLSVSNENREGDLMDTWQLLFQATQYSLDGGNSTIIANQVFNAWRIRTESRGARSSQQELENLRKYQQAVVANRDNTLRLISEQRQRELARSRGQNNAGPVTDERATSEAAFRMLDLAETESRILALESQTAMTGVQAKLQFQSQIVAFIIQRRFEHALILSGFYQAIFKGSHQALEVGRNQLEGFLPGSDLSFTVDSMSFIARDAINDVNRGVDAVNVSIEEGRMLVALERLQEVFFLGEYLTELNKIPGADRRRLLDLYRSLIDAGELAQAKDFDGVAELAQQISALAADFPANRVLSAVEAAKSASNMAVFAASQYRNLGDINTARAELQTAMEIWPSNPAIRDFQQETTRLATAGSQGSQIFDDLYSRQDWRGLYDRRMDLGFALADDAQRRPLLMEVIEKVARIDLLVNQSAELVQQGEAYAAWELLAEAARVDPGDAPLNRARAELAPQVAHFVQLLNRAERQSAEGQYAGALAAYLAAQDIYPVSRICRRGVQESTDALIKGLRAVQGVD